MREGDVVQTEQAGNHEALLFFRSTDVLARRTMKPGTEMLLPTATEAEASIEDTSAMSRLTSPS